MDQNADNISQLAKKLEKLITQQEELSSEIKALKTEFNTVSDVNEQAIPSPNSIPTTVDEQSNIDENQTSPIKQDEKPEIVFQHEWPSAKKLKQKKTKENKEKVSLERFIGENIISKIGIIILIIGVTIGTKYAVEHQLINQLTRVVLGYILGTVLLLVAIKLKNKYNAFSSVLLSGALTIFYFISFAAYSFYELIPLPITFALLFVFTAFAVVAAISYNRQIIAHIGLVGAYAIPFLLSKGSENIGFLLSYTALINIGILIIAIKRYWKSLYLSAFIVTWLIQLIWIRTDYMPEDYFSLASVFTMVFFLIFFVIFIIHKFINKERLAFIDVLLIIANSFIFYGIGYHLLSTHDGTEQFIGLFTLLTAFIHFIFSIVVYKSEMADRNLLYLTSGLVLTFLTITFPVQLDGSWVTLLWAGETALLFWIGRANRVKFYEYLAYILIFLSFFSLVHDWTMVYDSTYLDDPEKSIQTFLNINFFTSLLIVGVYSFVIYFDKIEKYLTMELRNNTLRNIMSITTPILLLLTIYFGISLEIGSYWNQLFHDSEITLLSDGEDPYPLSEWNTDLMKFKTIWLVNFTLIFLSILSSYFVFAKKKVISCWILQGVNVLAYIICFSIALWEISELRESYLSNQLSEYYDHGFYNIVIRYISVLFLVSFILSIHRLHVYLDRKLIELFDVLIASAFLWFLSSELLHWLDVYNIASSYKIAISILWGVFSLALVAYGIWKKKKHLRIMSFAILGVTILKMFIYDLSHLSTLSKAVIFISIGMLMLGVSFLYNKFKNQLIDETSL